MSLLSRISRALNQSAPAPVNAETVTDHQLQALEPRLLLSGSVPDGYEDAVVVPLVTSPVTVVDAVNRNDRIDLFRINIKEKTDLMLTLSGLSANADLNLIDSDGRFIERSRRSGSKTEQIMQTLEAGTYFVRVDSVRNAATTYNLELAFQPNAGSKADNTARDLGTITAPVSVTDSLDRHNRVDAFKFTLDTPSTVDIDLTGLSANAELQLLTEDGRILERSDRRGARSESIMRKLDEGAYFIRVIGKKDATTTYDLDVTALPAVGNTTETARDLGTITGTTTVANMLDPHDRIDVFQFDIDEVSDVNIELSGLSGDAELQLLNADGQVIDRSDRRGARSEMIMRRLEEGTYFVRIIARDGVSTAYTLEVEAVPEVGNTIDTATDLGTILGTTSVSNSVDNHDRIDVFRFSVDEASDVDLALTGMSDNANLQLLNEDGRVIGRSHRGGAKDEMIMRRLEAGTYYARVIRRGNASTMYDLDITVLPKVGNTLDTAFNVGLLSGMTTLTNRVDNHDRIDVFRFVIANESLVMVTLSGMTANADLQLLDADGGILQRSERPGAKDDSITRRLPAGTYFARVIRQETDETDYTLDLEANRIV